MNKTLFLLDAYALIFRAYYAFIRAPRTNSKGLNTSAIFGFTNTLRDIIERENPDYIGVVIDYPAPTFRNELYSEYKANREATPEDIKKAVPYITQILEAMKIPLIAVKGFEADDIIGTIAVKAAKQGFNTFMVTPDKDFAQLVNENIKMYKPGSKNNEIDILGIEEVKEKFGVPEPINVIDILALWGDTADNVPGCPGIGEKTAKTIISKYGTIENVYKNIHNFAGKQKENLIQYRKQVELAHKLVTIDTNAPYEFNAEDFKLVSPDLNQLKNIFEELEFKTLWSKISSENAAKTATTAPHNIFEQSTSQNFNQSTNKRQTTQETFFQGSLFGQQETTEQGSLFAQQTNAQYLGQTIEQIPTIESRFNTISKQNHYYYLIDTEDAIQKLVDDLSTQKSFSFDSETTGLDAFNDELIGFSFAFKPYEAYYIQMPDNFEKTKQIVNNFKNILENPNIEKIGQNIKYDALILKKYGVDICAPIFDTMVAHHLLQPGLKHNLDYLSETYLNYSPVPIESLIGAKGKGQKSMRQVPINIVKEYACEDADVTFQLKPILEKELQNEGLESFFHTVEMPMTTLLLDMEHTGVKIDTEELHKYKLILEERLTNLENKITTLAGIRFNINSPKQVSEVLFDRLKIGGNRLKSKKSGQQSTSEDVLQKLKSLHPIINLILEQRGVKKLLSTYVEALPRLVSTKTQRVHTSYNQAIVVTGRLSSSNPNLQNIPIRDEDGREIRKAFIVENSNLFLSADYSQIELRIMAHLSKDKNMIEAFKRGEDIHTATASLIYKVPLSDVTSDMRRNAKTANFGIIYGISSFGLSERLNISRSEAKKLIDGYFYSFPGVKNYMDFSINNARDKGYAETIFGRRRYLPDINSRNSIVRGIAERNAINAPIQGTAADIIKKAMVILYKKLNDSGLQSKMILQVHDELNFEVVVPELESLKILVKETMENACQLDVPLIVDMGVGKNWLEAH